MVHFRQVCLCIPTQGTFVLGPKTTTDCSLQTTSHRGYKIGKRKPMCHLFITFSVKLYFSNVLLYRLALYQLENLFFFVDK